jgi:hypothetical protein
VFYGFTLILFQLKILNKTLLKKTRPRFKLGACGPRFNTLWAGAGLFRKQNESWITFKCKIMLIIRDASLYSFEGEKEENLGLGKDIFTYAKRLFA